ncbi:L,D-transpeptidase [Roseibium denhamense]|uniref:Lipoprotein-anchoring transpeptidase ErfK/SrfK n=1 Tax=Roseibium denhamense TaxID=76305 RepID=A0ABY1NS83_9HYPH|nr:L,D-transpeptidase [Roseibium denhamense]MTI08118.1 L,D-transpeptidase [Roseibium denhamense]SMP16561.1 Lipoprotein-anchoring transpeptidase ErfK/SrfK [Roseibium denhamense]
MRTVFYGVIAVLVAAFILPENAFARAGFFDHDQKKWVTPKYHPGGPSPIKRRKVRYDGPYAPGTIVVDTSERRLYHILPNGRAMKYGVGVGKDGFQWSGTHRVTRKAEWPSWTPPAQMRARERRNGRILPAFMEGGPNNPMGARALYIGSTLYRIHGTTEPWTIGSEVSSGCIRMANKDVIHLYKSVDVGAKIVVKR